MGKKNRKKANLTDATQNHNHVGTKQEKEPLIQDKYSLNEVQRPILDFVESCISPSEEQMVVKDDFINRKGSGDTQVQQKVDLCCDSSTADVNCTQDQITQELDSIAQTKNSAKGSLTQRKVQNVPLQQEEVSTPKTNIPAQPRVKQSKTVSTKTFAHGLMDVSLLTSNATQLRSVLANPVHEFYTFLVCLISLSITLQIISGIILVTADYFKSSEGEKCEAKDSIRKKLNFASLAIVSNITAINILISAFYSPYSPTVKS